MLGRQLERERIQLLLKGAAEEAPTTKLQIPRKHQAPSSKSGCARRYRGWEFRASLEPGAWDLELPRLGRRRRRRRRGGWFVEIELHFRGFFGAGRSVEER